MDSPSPSRHSGFSARNSFVDVSQLDKVNAIPNKTTDNVLLSNLCPDDQQYLKFLMENDSSTSEDELEHARRNSSGAWSPMVQSPVMNKRNKGVKPSYAITLSLEDISYIRPSWGISKGIRTIEVDGKKKQKKKAKKLEKSDSAKDVSRDSKAANNDPNSEEITYKYFLLMLTLVVIFLTLPPYWAEQRRYYDQVNRHKLKVDKILRTMLIYQPDPPQQQPLGEPILRVEFAQGVPANLKPEECTCDVYEAELRKHTSEFVNSDSDNNNNNNDSNVCFSCLDWAVRANLRVLVEHKAEAPDICYSIKWQSYDSLSTPLIDCFLVEKNDQWFGLGDTQSSDWALNKLDFGWLPLTTNLTGEFSGFLRGPETGQTDLTLGSYVNSTFFSTAGIFIGDLRSDFRLSLKVESGKRICIRASCNDKCGRVWSRSDDLAEFRLSNNVLEYRICSLGNMKTLISNRISEKIKSLDGLVRRSTVSLMGEPLSGQLIDSKDSSADHKPHYERLIERESQPVSILQQQQQPSISGKLNLTSLPEGIGLIDRTIFVTSAEFLATLDGKTLRQYVDGVVKLGLKTSSIIMIDSRWETHIGSLQLNTILFPKWRLLFEIIHNKGFKVLLTMKPYIDTVIGAASVNQLFESGKLYGISQGLNRVEQDVRGQTTVLRRNSLFSVRNESIEIGQNGSTTSRPYVFKCKESQVGYCVLIDLNRGQTRGWLANQIGRSELLSSSSADGIMIAGAHPDGFSWDDHYREGLSNLVRDLYFKERIFTLPQWTGDLGYIQLAPRPFTWNGLRSVVGSVLNLGLEGFSLVHPGSVWGDLKSAAGNLSLTMSQARKEPAALEDYGALERSNEELCIRWLQVAVFLPILQFNNLAPIERYNLQGVLQNLVKIRKVHIIAALKRNLPYTPLISQSKFNASSSGSTTMSLIRPVWFNQQPDTVVAEQFSIGSDILVAPVLSEHTRQRDIYLPNGFWRDELRQTDIRGGKWLRNYPVELNEIAWFTKAKR